MLNYVVFSLIAVLPAGFLDFSLGASIGVVSLCMGESGLSSICSVVFLTSSDEVSKIYNGR